MINWKVRSKVSKWSGATFVGSVELRSEMCEPRRRVISSKWMHEQKTQVRASNDDVAQHGGLTRVNTSLVVLVYSVYFRLDIVLWSIDTCQNKISAYSITWLWGGLRFKAHRALVFFRGDYWPSTGFSIGSRAHVWLIWSDQGWVVRKPVNSNPELKVDRSMDFSPIQMYFTAFES